MQTDHPHMTAAPEIEPIAPGVSIWRAYDQSVKAELFSTALQTGAGTYLVDPIPLDEEAIEELSADHKVIGIVVTNENHERAAARFAKRFGVSIHLHADLIDAMALPAVIGLRDGATLARGVKAVEIEGAAAGEIALLSDAGSGTMVIGDALINFEPYGFALLPAKYCTNQKEMRASLARLLDFNFDRMLFAHGLPILSDARQRLKLLLQEHG